MLQQLSDNLFLYRDTCNVYVLRDGTNAVLIDFGSGDVLSEMAALNVYTVSDVLMTHHHRDQGQGLARAVQIGARIWVPDAEQDLFADVDAHWQARTIYNNYDVRQDRFSLLTSVPVAGPLRDYDSPVFGPHNFSVIPTPGHTVGSASLLAEVDGKRIAFTGDLIAAPGKVWSLAATQWTYNGGQGISSSILSLLDLRDHGINCLLPSHGDPMSDPAAAIDLTVSRLLELQTLRAENPRLMLFHEHPYKAISPHLLQNLSSMSNAYVLKSESGKALFIDFGYDFGSWPLPSGEGRASRRPWLHSLPALKRDFGIHTIDVVIPTHHHDDHVAGINALRRVERTKVWAAENFADVLERPENYNLPCLWYDPIPVDRRLPLEQAFQWEEYTLTVYALPGHTRYAVAIAFEVDGVRVLATGDQYQGGNGGTEFNYVYDSHFDFDDYRRSAELYARLDPQLIITGHWAPLQVQPDYFATLLERGEALARLHHELLASVPEALGGNDFVARIEPYQMMVTDGDEVSVEVITRNPSDHDDALCVRLIVPPEWSAAPLEATAVIGAHAEAHFNFTVSYPAGTVLRRARLAADVTVGKQHIGQHAEALITVRPPNRADDPNELRGKPMRSTGESTGAPTV